MTSRLQPHIARSIHVLLVASLWPGYAIAQDGIPRKEVRAVRAAPAAPHLDGRLDDPAWGAAHFVSDFLQKEPVEGAVPTESTQVAVVYDADALYIGARCYSRAPDRLRRLLDRRDRQGPAEQFIVTIDSYLDRRTGYGFGVNTAGVRFDRYNPEDFEFNRDFTYDPVWSARTGIDSVSWCVEMRIPFSQLRFNKRSEQVWGINFNRWVPARNEDIYWIYVPREGTGWTSRFGNLTGIAGIAPSRRLELLPYAAGSRQWPTDAGPFSALGLSEERTGGDLKMGLGPNLTLDATFNPDFGQVEADPAEVNLSAYETFFSERRPFFLEGSQLLAGNGPSYYYSRRIGARSKILGAGKVTGRLASGTSIGFLGAVSERDLEQNVPAAGFAVGRVAQQFGSSQSQVGASIAAVERDLSASNDLEQAYRKRALSGGGDWELRFRNGMYVVSGSLGVSHIQGSRASILAAQESSARYYQRPDVDYVTLDSTRTSLFGYTVDLGVAKNGGRHWLWSVEGGAESPGFELNDAGRLSTTDNLGLYGRVAYRETEPRRVFRSYVAQIESYGEWNYGRTRQYSDVNVYQEASWHNFWNTWLSFNRRFPAQDDSRTRGGPTMKREGRYSLGTGFRSNFGAATQYNGSVNVAFDDLDGWLYAVTGQVNTRLGNRLQLSLGPRYQREDQPRQYVATVADAGGGPGTFGKRYVFSRIARTTIAAEIRASYFFTPDLSLELYMQPFAASGNYYDHGELIAAGDNDLLVYGRTPDTEIGPAPDSLGLEPGALLVTDNSTTSTFTLPAPGFHSLFFRSNMVLRWEFRPGSTLYLVWQRNLDGEGEPGRSSRASDLLDTFSAPGDDFLAFKIAYWIPLL